MSVIGYVLYIVLPVAAVTIVVTTQLIVWQSRDRAQRSIDAQEEND